MKRFSIKTCLAVALPAAFIGCSVPGTAVRLPAALVQPVTTSNIVGIPNVALPANAKSLGVVQGRAMESISQSSSSNGYSTTSTTTSRHENNVASEMYTILGDDPMRCINGIVVTARTIYTISGVKTAIDVSGQATLIPAQAAATPVTPAEPATSDSTGK